MLTFFGYIGKQLSLLNNNDDCFQNTLTDNGKYAYCQYSRDDMFFSFADYSMRSNIPVCDISEKVFVLAAGHLYEWADGSPNSSDKELSREVLRVYLNDGINALHDCKGKYSIVIVDKRYDNSGKVFLLKDRLGFSPLYYHENEHGICFATRAESIGVCGILKPQLNADAIVQAFYLGVVFEGLCFYKNVFNLTGGNYLTFQSGNTIIEANPVPLKWPELQAVKSIDCVDALAESTIKAVKRIGTYCKKPIRFFLSGGADSRLILTSLLRQGQDFYAVTEYEFQEDEPDVVAAKELQKKFGFKLDVIKSQTRDQEVTSNMLGKIYAHDDHNIFTIKGFGDPRNWFKPMEVKSLALAEKAFGAVYPFTNKILDTITFNIKEMSQKYIDKRPGNELQKTFTHNMANLFGTFLRSTETDSHARPQNRFHGTLHIPYLDEDAVTSTANIPPMMPSRKIKLFTEVLKRHFPEHPDVPIVHKFMTKTHQATTSRVGDSGENLQCKMAVHDHELYTAYETPARKIIANMSNDLIGTIISEKCLDAAFFPPQFSLSIIFWNTWKKLYFRSV